MTKKGFTLIEILVVIAIIGLLSSIILTFLTGARNKGNDKNVVSNLNSLRNAIEFYYYNNDNSYGDNALTPPGTTIGTGCNSGMFSSASIQKHVEGSNYPPYAQGTGQCFSNSTRYSVRARLQTVNTWWCIDSNNKSKQTNSLVSPIDGSFLCP